MLVEYEWIVEHVEGDEVVFTDYYKTYRNAMSAWTRVRSEGKAARVALLRDHPMHGREWAYITGARMAMMFSDAEGSETRPVPQRYRLEYARG